MKQHMDTYGKIYRRLHFAPNYSPDVGDDTNSVANPVYMGVKVETAAIVQPFKKAIHQELDYQIDERKK